jgi:hypothetical protein
MEEKYLKARFQIWAKQVLQNLKQNWASELSQGTSWVVGVDGFSLALEYLGLGIELFGGETQVDFLPPIYRASIGS